MTQQPKKAFYQVRDGVRLNHYSYRVELSCVNWIILHIFVHTVRHPADMTPPASREFRRTMTTCLRENAQFDIAMHGQTPFSRFRSEAA